MNPVCAGLFSAFLFVFTSCEKPPSSVAAPPKTGAVIAKSEAEAAAKFEAERTKFTTTIEALKRKIAELERTIAEQERTIGQLRGELEAQRQAALARERQALEAERAAWLRERQEESAKRPVTTTKELPPPSYPPPRKYCDFREFYDSLESYGCWMNCPDYGYVWQPACAHEDGWRPYTVGQWYYSDCGWTWHSHEPFGWATYHYGRWACLPGYGWIWVPGDQWAPCWVAWRRTDQHIGWCPLPPETLYDRDCTHDSLVDKRCGLPAKCYTFVLCKNFCEPVRKHCLAVNECIKIYSVSQNITKIIIKGDRVDCQGPSVEWIHKICKKTPPRCQLVSVDQPVLEPVTDGDRKKLPVYAPRVSAPWNHDLKPNKLLGNLPGQNGALREGLVDTEMLRKFLAARDKHRQEAVKSLGFTGQRLQQRGEVIAKLEAGNPLSEAAHESITTNVEAPTGSAAVPVPAAEARVDKEVLEARLAQEEKLRKQLTNPAAQDLERNRAIVRGRPVQQENPTLPDQEAAQALAEKKPTASGLAEVAERQNFAAQQPEAEAAAHLEEGQRQSALPTQQHARIQHDPQQPVPQDLPGDRTADRAREEAEQLADAQAREQAAAAEAAELRNQQEAQRELMAQAQIEARQIEIATQRAEAELEQQRQAAELAQQEERAREEAEQRRREVAAAMEQQRAEQAAYEAAAREQAARQEMERRQLEAEQMRQEAMERQRAEQAAYEAAAREQAARQEMERRQREAERSRQEAMERQRREAEERARIEADNQ